MRARIAVVLLAVAAVLAAAAGAQAAPRHNHGLTIAVTPNPIVAGQGVLIYGQLNGSDNAGQTIRLYHRINPAARFTLIQTGRTNAQGFYSFSRAEGVVTTNRNWYVTGPGGTHSRTVHERVSAQVTLNGAGGTATAVTRTKQTFTGSVYPAHRGELVRLQQQTAISGNGWATIAQGRTNANSGFTLTHSFKRPGDYTVRVLFGGDRRNLASASDTLTVAVQQKQLAGFSIATSAPVIADGNSATITGTYTAAPGTEVTLFAATHGQALKAVAQTPTDGSDGYSFTVTPTANTVYQVRAGKGHHSAQLNQGVSDVLSATPSATSLALGQPLKVTGTVTPSHVGHLIYLQQQTAAGHWSAIAAATVGTGSGYSLTSPFGKPGTYTLRVRIFGGPANVGAASTPFTLTVTPALNPAGLPAAR